MQRNALVLITLGIAFSATAMAGSVTFDVSIDTSSVSGTGGGIYLSFFPGLNSDPASVSISGFSPADGLAGGPAFTDGGVTGTLDTNDLSFTNYLFSLNDYGENVTFGSTLDLEATFQLPDTLTGDAGSELDIQLTEFDLATPILTSDPSGNIAEISYDQNGNFTANPTSGDVTITQVGAAPEPATFLIAGCALIGLSYVRKRTLPAKPRLSPERQYLRAN
jgi:hypothetical protein